LHISQKKPLKHHQANSCVFRSFKSGPPDAEAGLRQIIQYDTIR